MDRDTIINYIYKDLCYTSDSLFMSEQIYPTWEAIYTIVVSGLLVVYFEEFEDFSTSGRVAICLIGFVLSMSWFFLVKRIEKFSQIRTMRMRALERALNERISRQVKIKYNFDIDTDHVVFNLFSLEKVIYDKMSDSRFGFKRNVWWTWKNGVLFWRWRTWSYRKSVPLFLGLIWLFLLIDNFTHYTSFITNK